MHQQFNRELLISFVILFGGLIVVGAAFFLLSRDLALQAEKAATARELIRQRAMVLEVLAGLKKEAPQAVAYKAALNRVLVSQDQLLDFPRWLDGLARGRRVALEFSFRGSQVAPEGQKPGSVGFSADLSGGLSSIVGFLKDIELQSSRFLLGLENFELNGGGDSYVLKISGRVYFR